MREKILVGFIILMSINLYAQVAVPENSPDEWILAFVDVETTGLKPGYHEIIDFGVVLSDLNGAELDRLFVRIMPQFPERASQGAIEVNSFSKKRWAQLETLSPVAAVDSIVQFHKRIADGRKILMVAFNSQFDTAFIDHLFRSVDQSWRELYYYYVLDIPSMAWANGIRSLHGQKLSKYFSIPDEPHTPEEHTGITGADLNYRLYKEIIQQSD